MPSGIFFSLTSRFFKASCMKSNQIGKAIVDPYSFSPSEVKSSVPTHTVVTKSSWKPENQVLTASFVVPVFPPISFLFKTEASVLNRKDIGGKTGTTNDAVSTWFSGFHEDLVTTVWVGTDDFTSLGENEYGSTIALPIWLDFMQDALKNLEVKEKNIPEGISFVKVNKKTGVIDNSLDSQTYFELILDENLED